MKFTNKDAIVLLSTGSSNAGGEGADMANLHLDDASETPLEKCHVWGRFTNGATRAVATGTPVWEEMTNTQNLSDDAFDPIYFAAKELRERFFPANRTAEGRPRGIYCIKSSFPFSNVTHGYGDVNPGLGMGPFDRGDLNGSPVVNSAWNIWADGYVRQGLEALFADPDIERVFIAGMIFVGNESAGLDAGSNALGNNASTPYRVESGMVALVRATEKMAGLSEGELPVVAVLPSRAMAGVDLGATFGAFSSAAGISIVRGGMTAALQAQLPNLTGVLDGEAYALRNNEFIGAETDTNVHLVTDDIARMGRDCAKELLLLGSTPVEVSQDDIPLEVWTTANAE